jgi:hypothetical protein
MHTAMQSNVSFSAKIVKDGQQSFNFRPFAVHSSSFLYVFLGDSLEHVPQPRAFARCTGASSMLYISVLVLLVPRSSNPIFKIAFSA